MKKKPSRKTLTNKLDKVFSLLTRSRKKCEYCGIEGEIGNFNPHHIFSRALRSVRWDKDNIICLCPKHHLFDKKFSAHGAPLAFSVWIKKSRGEEWYKRLLEKVNTPKNFSDEEMIKMLEEFEKKWEKIK